MSASETAEDGPQLRPEDILERISDAFYAVDRDWRLVYVNREAERLWGRSRADLLGKNLWEAFPQAVGTFAYEQHLRAVREDRALLYETISPVIGRWVETNICPGPTVVSVYFHDVSERKRAEEERDRLLAAEQEARANAEVASRTRDELLASVSHDLRSPLGAIKAYAQLLRRDLQAGREPDLARLAELAARIDASTTTMATMIDEVVDVARVQMGQPLALRRRPTDLVALVGRVVETRQAATPDHPIHLASAVPALAGTWDPARLERVVVNLLDNAVKYSPPGATVDVQIRREDAAPGAQAAIEVRDRGIGIPADDLPHVFERFRRGSNAPPEVEGNGIGLATVRQIVEQHGGAITLSSVMGEGTLATVRLPLDENPASA